MVSSTPQPHFTPGKDPAPIFTTDKAVAITERNVATSKASKYGWCFSAVTYCTLSDILLLICPSVHLYGADQLIIFVALVAFTRGFVCDLFRNKIRFHGEELLAPRPTPKLEDHPLSALHSSIRNLRARHAVVTGNPLITWDRWRTLVNAVMNLRVP